MIQTEFATSDTTLALANNGFWGPALPPFEAEPSSVNDVPFRSTYELRYTGDSTRATEIWYEVVASYEVPIWVPFEVWNVNTNTRVSLSIYDWADNWEWDSGDLIAIIDYPYDATASVFEDAYPYLYSWMFELDAADSAATTGDVFSIDGAPLNSPDDRFVFKVDGINAAHAKDQLADIKVVPNPYYARNSRVETAQGETVLKFINLPGECTIRIYTLAGDLVNTINHTDGSGEDEWNLLSSSRLQVASGMYLYHIESPYGERLGRFAVIK